MPYPAVSFYRENTRTLSAVLALTPRAWPSRGEESPQRTYFVSGNFFTELGGSASAGRLFTATDEAPTAPTMVVLGHGFWTRQFGRNPGRGGYHDPPQRPGRDRGGGGGG